tara:strand:- start:267035 stop:267478 length:444 start_codon:yes stop_codon:yes gene_type:complete
MKSRYLFLSLLFSIGLFGQSETSNTYNEDAKAIRLVLKTQQDAWNKFDLEGFMQGYWKSDSLKFYGSNGITKGWQKTLDNYKKGYPSREHIGELQFTLKSISPIEDHSYYVMGQYYLKRSVGDAHGEFLIILKKINGEWKIIADMSS